MNKKDKAIDPSSKKILIGGTVRNGGQALKDDVLFLQNALSNIPNKHWFIVESDSSDNTHEILRELEDSVENFRFISLGSLSKRIAERTKRIAYISVKLYLKWFFGNGEVPCLDWKPPRSTSYRKRRSLNEQQVSSLFSILNGNTAKGVRDIAMISLMLDTGLRV